ncbi:MAG: A24 family peptidase, partial [Gammaproteobacteria bacterium]
MHPLVELLSAQPALFVAVVVLFTLLIGSFLNVVIHRLPIMMHREWTEECEAFQKEEGPDTSKLPEKYNLVVPRSACPKCGHKITALQNIPVLSYLLLRGRCAGCKTPISKRYPIIEAFTGAACGYVAWHFGFGLEALMAIVLTLALIALSMIDFDTQFLPDSIVLPMLWLGLVMSLFFPMDGAQTLFIDPRTAIIGAAAGYLSLWSVYQVYKLLTGKIGMGHGDFK